jgi:hypothetical protein
VASRPYKVAVLQRGLHYIAYLYDLDCEASGATADEAVANLRRDAEDVLKKYEDCPSYEPPWLSDITIVTMELPAPVTQRRSDDTSAA